MNLKTWLYDTAEKAGATLVEVAIVYVIAAQAIDSEFWRGLLVAVVTALANVGKAALTAWMPHPTNWLADMAVRALWTFIITMFGSLASVNWFDLINVGFWRQVALAALTAALAVLKAGLAKLRADKLHAETDGEVQPLTPASLVTLKQAA